MLDQAVDICALGRGRDWDAARRRFAEFDRVLRRRMKHQEQVWFPLFEQRAADDRPTRVLRLEHRRIDRALDLIGAALARRDLDALDAGERELHGVLRAHVIKEERILFPVIGDAVE